MANHGVRGLLAHITVYIPGGPSEDLPTGELVLDGIVEAINRCGRWGFWAPQDTRVEGVELAAPELTEVRP